jgi:hypothetical protein
MIATGTSNRGTSPTGRGPQALARLDQSRQFVRLPTASPPLDRLVFDAEVKGASRPGCASLTVDICAGDQKIGSSSGRPREWSHFRQA